MNRHRVLSLGLLGSLVAGSFAACGAPQEQRRETAPEMPAETAASPEPAAAEPAGVDEPAGAEEGGEAAPAPAPGQQAGVLGSLRGDGTGLERHFHLELDSVNGAFDADEGKAALDPAVPGFQTCLQASPGPAGASLRLEFSVVDGKAGPVVSVFEAKDPKKGKLTIRSVPHALARCVATTLSNQNFPNESQPTKISARVVGQAPAIGDGFGVGGLGVRGTGAGGGGTGYGLSGIGAGVGGGGTAKGSIRAGAATSQGSLDKNIIRRYVRRSLSRIRYCYEKELINNPSLAGRVVVSFTISPSGKVTQAQGSGLVPVVDTCVAGAVQSIQFPKPKGGGTVKVNYPFVFKPN